MTTKDGEKLDEEEVKKFYPSKLSSTNQLTCPDCESVLFEGPHGGLSINYYCSNELSCGSRFNEMGPFGIQRISNKSPNKPPVAEGPYRS